MEHSAKNGGLLTVKEAADWLRIHKKTLYRLIAARKIPFKKVEGLGIRFRPSELDEWVDGRWNKE